MVCLFRIQEQDILTDSEQGALGALPLHAGGLHDLHTY